jgi:hypothetical protein
MVLVDNPDDNHQADDDHGCKQKAAQRVSVPHLAQALNRVAFVDHGLAPPAQFNFNGAAFGFILALPFNKGVINPPLNP